MLYVSTVAVNAAAEGLSDSDILDGVTTRERRARLAVHLQEIDAWAQTDTRKITLPALLLGMNLREFERAELLKSTPDAEVLADAEKLLGHGDPCAR